MKRFWKAALVTGVIVGSFSVPAFAQNKPIDADDSLYQQVDMMGKSYFHEADMETELTGGEVFLAILRQEGFDALEKRIQDLQRAPLTAAGNMPLYLLLHDLGFVETDKVYLDEWCARFPKSPFAFMARGEFYRQSAWRARGSGFASTVKEGQWNIFRDLIKKSGEDLKHARQLAPSLGVVYILLVEWAGNGGSDLEEAIGYFGKGAVVLKGSRDLYNTMLWAYMPRWSGSEDKMFLFVRRSIGEYPQLGWMLGKAHREAAYGVSNYQENKAFCDYFKRPGVWEQILAAYKPCIRAFPHSKINRVGLFRYAVFADRVDEVFAWFAKEKL
jgi:Domain of unknown function (DUF4034)